MSHTPGPWSIEQKYGHSSGERDVITADSVARIAIISRNGVNGDAEASANARLIAAAPTMLDALQSVIVALEHDVPGSCWATGPNTGDPIEDLVVCPGCRALANVHEAITKATGDTP